MTKLNYARAQQDSNMRRYGSEALDGSGYTAPRPSEGSRREGPDVFHAILKARYAVTDVGVRFALAAAEQGFRVIYANQRSPGEKSQEALAAANIEVVICKGK